MDWFLYNRNLHHERTKILHWIHNFRKLTKSSNMEEHDVKPAVKIDGNLNPL